MKDSAKEKEYRANIDAAVRYARNSFWPRCSQLRQYWRRSALSTEAPDMSTDIQLTGGQSEFVRSAIIMPVVEAQVAGLMPRNPKTRAIPRKEFFKAKGGTISSDKTVPVIEKIADYDIEQGDLRTAGKRALRDGRLLGMGAIEVGWDPWFGRVAIEDRNVEQGTEGGKDVKVKTNLRYQEYIRKASPYYRYRRAEDVLLPAFIQSAADAPFLILKNRRVLYEAVADPNFDRIKDKNELIEKAGLEWMTDDGVSSDEWRSERKNGALRMCLEYHVWNRADNVYAVYIDGVDDPVRWDEWPYDYEAVDGFPIKLYIPLPSDNEPYGVSPMSYLIPQQQEINKLRSKMAEMVAKWRNITLYDKNDTDPNNVDAIKRAEEGSLIGVDSIRNFMPMPAMMDSLQYLIAYESRIREDVRIQSNVTDFQLAGTGNSSFATDSALLAQAQSARREDEAVAVRKFFGDVVKFGFQLRQELMTGDQEVKITGETAEWLKVSPEQIVGEYDFHLEVEDAPSDSQRAREDAKILLEGFYGKPEADGVEVLKRVAKLLKQPTDVVKGVDQFSARREAEYENEMLLNADPSAEMIRPAPQENFEIHVQSHQEAAQRAQQEGRDPTALMEHLQLTMQMSGMKEQQEGKKMSGTANPVTGQQRMSGKVNQGNPTERVRSGDTGALRGMMGAG